MDRAKYRGFRADGKGWVYGCLIVKNKIPFISTSFRISKYSKKIGYAEVEVKAHSVGQFTGFLAEKCKTNLEKEIYEADVFRETIETDNGDVYRYHVAVWVRQRGAFAMIPKESYEDFMQNDLSKDQHFDWLFEEAQLFDFSIDVGLTKVGNIHESEVLNG